MRPGDWPIFILTLSGEDQRRAPLLAALRAAGLDYELLYGVDGRQGLPPELEDQVDRPRARARYGRALTDGEFACALSHQAAYQEILARGLEGAVILEDDAIPTELFFAFMQKQLYRRSPLMMLDHSHARVARQGKPLMAGVESYALTLPCCRSTGYSLDAASAETLTRWNAPVSYQADWPGDISRLQTVALLPQIIGHPDELSGVSHLDSSRNQIPSDANSLQRGLARLVSASHWRRWLIKRLSRRIS